MEKKNERDLLGIKFLRHSLFSLFFVFAFFFCCPFSQPIYLDADARENLCDIDSLFVLRVRARVCSSIAPSVCVWSRCPTLPVYVYM